MPAKAEHLTPHVKRPATAPCRSWLASEGGASDTPTPTNPPPTPVGAGLPAKRPLNPLQDSKPPSPTSRLLQNQNQSHTRHPDFPRRGATPHPCAHQSRYGKTRHFTRPQLILNVAFRLEMLNPTLYRCSQNHQRQQHQQHHANQRPSSHVRSLGQENRHRAFHINVRHL